MGEKHVREYQRTQCITLRKASMFYRPICSNVGIFRASIQRALKRFETTGSFQDCPRCDRQKNELKKTMKIEVLLVK